MWLSLGVQGGDTGGPREWQQSDTPHAMRWVLTMPLMPNPTLLWSARGKHLLGQLQPPQQPVALPQGQRAVVAPLGWAVSRAGQ